MSASRRRHIFHNRKPILFNHRRHHRRSLPPLNCCFFLVYSHLLIPSVSSSFSFDRRRRIFRDITNYSVSSWTHALCTCSGGFWNSPKRTQTSSALQANTNKQKPNTQQYKTPKKPIDQKDIHFINIHPPCTQMDRSINDAKLKIHATEPLKYHLLFAGHILRITFKQIFSTFCRSPANFP